MTNDKHTRTFADKEKQCYIKTEDGKHFLYMPDGTKVPFVIMTRVTDDTHQSAVALVKLFVRLE